MDRLTPVEQFADLRSISDNVDDYLSRELYLDSFGNDGDYTVNDILSECYTIVLQELRELGIFFTMDIDDLLADWYTAKNIYHLRVLCDSKTITTLCEDKEVYNTLSTLIQDTDDDCGELITSIVEYLQNKYPSEVAYQYLLYFNQYVYSTDRFKDHLSVILDKIEKQDPGADIPDVTAAAEYIRQTLQLQKLAKIATDIILSTTGFNKECNGVVLDKLLADYDMDKISTDELRLYCLLDNSQREVPKQLQHLKDVMLQKHHERSPHHIEHWITHQDEHPTKENLVVLVAHHFEPDTTKDEFAKAVENMLDQGINIFTPEDVEFIQKCKMSLLQHAFTSEHISIKNMEDE